MRFFLPGVLAALVLQITSGCCHNCHSTSTGHGDPNKYALLVSTETATPASHLPSNTEVPMNSEFWNDLVSTYCTLRDHGFSDDNIFVLYGEGKDHSCAVHSSYRCCYCDGQVKRITDIPLNKSLVNVCNVLCCLSSGQTGSMADGTCQCTAGTNSSAGGFFCSKWEIPKLGGNDVLVTWFKGHGSLTPGGCDTALTIIEDMNGHGLNDDNLAALFAKLNARNLLIYFETCHAGGWIKELKDTGKPIIVTSSSSDNNCQESSYAGTYPEAQAGSSTPIEVTHGRFSYWLSASLNQRDATTAQQKADADLNNLVSVQESYDFLSKTVCDENNNLTIFQGIMKPEMSDPQKTAPSFYLHQPVP